MGAGSTARTRCGDASVSPPETWSASYESPAHAEVPNARPLDLRGLPRHHRAEHELAALDVHLDHVAGLELALEQPHRQRVLHAALQGSLERARAEVRVVALLGQPIAC